MKFVAEIRNVDSLEAHTLDVEGKTPQSTHKHILMNVLENNEEVVLLTDDSGHIVFEAGTGFTV